MKEFEIPPFHVGQEVVAIKNHSQGRYKIGDEFIVEEIIPSNCKCGGWVISIGLTNDVPGTDCLTCYKEIHPTKIVFHTKNFAPKHSYGEFISMKQLAETQLETIGAN